MIKSLTTPGLLFKSRPSATSLFKQMHPTKACIMGCLFERPFPKTDALDWTWFSCLSLIFFKLILHFCTANPHHLVAQDHKWTFLWVLKSEFYAREQKNAKKNTHDDSLWCFVLYAAVVSRLVKTHLIIHWGVIVGLRSQQSNHSEANLFIGRP